MMKYLVSIRMLANVAQRYWRRYHSTGVLMPVTIDVKKRYALVELRNFTLGSSSHCRYLEGYFWEIISFIVPGKKLQVREINRKLGENEMHRFEIKW